MTQANEPGQANLPGDTLDPAFADYLLGSLAGALPPAGDAAAGDARRNALRVAFMSMRPRNAIEAMLAVEAITAHHVIMDCFRVALRPETDPAAAARARSSAATLSRVRLATLRLLEQQQAPATASPRPARPARPKVDAATPVETPEAASLPQEPPPQEPPPIEPPRYRPRDRLGNPIELFRWEDMTMAQRRAAFADPGDAGAREAALAEEAAAIAAGAALQPDAIEPEPGADTPLTPRPAAAPC